MSGHFVGSTDEIIQWAAWKWGVDEDVIRAVAVTESGWHQDAVAGDGITFGLMQVKTPLGGGGNGWPGTFPLARDSTPFNVDSYGRAFRSCYDGRETWLAGGYSAGNGWGCVGLWFSGDWLDSGAAAYIARVKQHLAARPWEAGILKLDSAMAEQRAEAISARAGERLRGDAVLPLLQAVASPHRPRLQQVAHLLGAAVAPAHHQPERRLRAEVALLEPDAQDADVDRPVGVEPLGQRAEPVVPVARPHPQPQHVDDAAERVQVARIGQVERDLRLNATAVTAGTRARSAAERGRDVPQRARGPGQVDIAVPARCGAEPQLDGAPVHGGDLERHRAGRARTDGAHHRAEAPGRLEVEAVVPRDAPVAARRRRPRIAPASPSSSAPIRPRARRRAPPRRTRRTPRPR